MHPFPNFQNAVTFPSFAALSLSQDAPPESSTHYLIATIQENMTFSDTPTFICKDREAASFALKLTRVPGSFDVKSLKTGWSVVVAGASRSGVVKEKQGFVEVAADEIKMIPTTIGNLIFMSGNALIVATAKEGDGNLVFCDGCGEEKTRNELLSCRGCEFARYCGKECQKKGWSEGGHKNDCKILNVVRGLELGDRGWES